MKPAAEAPIIFIDSNEEATHTWSTQLRLFGLGSQITPMKCGDFRFIAQQRMWVIERKKAPSDLEASFTDGRLSNQFFMAEEEGVIDSFILLIEGDPNQVVLDPNIKAVLFELQSKGVFIDFCKTGGVPERLWHLHNFLSADDHSYLRRPPLPMPKKYTYTDRGLRERVQTFLTVRGLGEDAIVAALRKYTFDELYQNPVLFRECWPSVSMATVRKVYEHFQREVPEDYNKKVITPRKGKDIVEDIVEDKNVIAFKRLIG